MEATAINSGRAQKFDRADLESGFRRSKFRTFNIRLALVGLAIFAMSDLSASNTKGGVNFDQCSEKQGLNDIAELCAEHPGCAAVLAAPNDCLAAATFLQKLDTLIGEGTKTFLGGRQRSIHSHNVFEAFLSQAQKDFEKDPDVQQILTPTFLEYLRKSPTTSMQISQQVYVGELVNGQATGWGYKFGSGVVSRGYWVNGAAIGPVDLALSSDKFRAVRPAVGAPVVQAGVSLGADGSMYKGPIDFDFVRRGPGVLTQADGATIEVKATYRASLNGFVELRTVEGCLIVQRKPDFDALYSSASWSGTCDEDSYSIGPGTLLLNPSKTMRRIVQQQGWMHYGRLIGDFTSTYSDASRPTYHYWWNHKSYSSNVRRGDLLHPYALDNVHMFYGVDNGKLFYHFVSRSDGLVDLQRIGPSSNESAVLATCKWDECNELWWRYVSPAFDEMDVFTKESSAQVAAAKQYAMPAYLAAKERKERAILATRRNQIAKQVVENSSARQFDFLQATNESRPVKTPNIDQLVQMSLGR